jgi:hypothetical protein
MSHDNQKVVLAAVNGNTAIALAKLLATEVCVGLPFLRSRGLLGVVVLVALANCRTSMRANPADARGAGGTDYALDAAGPPPDLSPPVPADAALDPQDVDTQSACVVPSAGAACTSDQVPCATCCTDHWSCSDGIWQNQWLGCLPTTFACGGHACAETTDYCETDLHFGGLPLPTTYSCQPLPAACNGWRCPTCDCLAQAGISFSSCIASPSGAINVIR